MRLTGSVRGSCYTAEKVVTVEGADSDYHT